MSEHYDFHYQPTGSGAISGQQVLQQTEDAINELGDYVNDNVGGAMDVAQQALETAQNAEQDAQTALDTANSFSSAIQSAQQDASTALSTAQTAQTTASNANNTAIQASQDASSAVTTANNASGQVSTLSGTVTALGQRVTTAEGNIGQNTSDITALTTRVGTAEGNITTLQNDVTIAQGNASSAMATAGQVKQQAFVFRYSSTALVASSTNSNSLLDNTDNLKIGDKVIDSNGVLFSITAIDTQNSTFTIGTALIDLAQDSDVVHKSGNETISGTKTFLDVPIPLKSSTAELGVTGGNTKVIFTDKNLLNLAGITFGNYGGSKLSYCRFHIYDKDSNNQEVENFVEFSYVNNNQIAYFRPNKSNFVTLGTVNNRWSKVYADEFYYGSNNVEFSTKFVTTDTNQTITGNKIFSSDITLQGATTPIIKTISNIVQDTSAYNGSVSWVIRDKDNLNNILESSLYKYSAKSIDWQLKLTGIDNGVSNTKGIRFTLDPVNNVANFIPIGNNNTSLGNFSTKWKDVNTYLVNGVEPSSLSLPSNRSSRIDISSYITNLGNGGNNQYIAPANGYVWLHFTSINGCLCYSQTSGGLTNYAQTFVRYSGDGLLYVFFPVRKDDYFIAQIYTSSTAVVQNAYFIPCQGNV